jgi:hypothetical protein
MYNSFKSKKSETFSDPDQFVMEIANEVLRKMTTLRNKYRDVQLNEN